MADRFLSPDDGASSPELRQAALDKAIKFLVGDCRASVQQLEHYLDELTSLGDERAVEVIEALGLTLDRAAPPGTLRHLESAASKLLRTLASLAEVVRPPR